MQQRYQSYHQSTASTQVHHVQASTPPGGRPSAAAAPGAPLADLLTVREVARTLRVDDTTVRRWIKAGILRAVTLPHRAARQAYRIPRSELDALLNTESFASGAGEGGKSHASSK